MSDRIHIYTNKSESPEFLSGALAWRGSITPRILPSLLLLTSYALTLVVVDHYWKPLPHLDVTPFEYTGAVLGLVLVFRTNAGHERWWEARKLWGSIVNQSRNLVTQALNYGPEDSIWRENMVKWTIAFSFSVREFLRSGNNFDNLKDLFSEQDLYELSHAEHKAVFVADQLTRLLSQARYRHDIDGFAFQMLEEQRKLLIDHVGGCERILKTPMPLVYAIKTRRFIFIFLLLLPFSLISKTSYYSVFVFMLVAYPLLSLDRIGIELQNPFSTKNLSHLPLHSICDTIKNNCLALLSLHTKTN